MPTLYSISIFKRRAKELQLPGNRNKGYGFVVSPMLMVVNSGLS